MDYLLKKISNLKQVSIIQYDRSLNKQAYFGKNIELNPLEHSVKLKKELIKGCYKQEEPFIYKDVFDTYYFSIRNEDKCYMIGPMSIRHLDYVETHQYYQFYDIKTDTEKKLISFTFAEIMDLVELLANILLDKEYTDDVLIHANKLVTASRKQEEYEKVLYDIRENDEELYHHTYQEERKLLECVRTGMGRDALHYTRNMDSEIGKLSGKELNHWKNLAIVAIALCTRSAIEGGLSPAIAYRLSDFYIQKCDECNSIVQVIKYRDHAVEELSSQVQKRLNRKTSNYVEQCKDYINKNYKNKIYLQDIANELCLSETYLSKLFKKETGICVQDFVINVRLEHVTNLLKYSDENLPNIAEYVNFPSQSYMGKFFKKKYGMTPAEYRKKYKPSEFNSRKE